MVDIKDGKKPLGKQTRQLAVVHETDFIDALRFVVTATTQVFIDVLEVGQTHFHLEVVRLSLFGKGE